MINDGTALVAYRVALVAVVEGSFSAGSAALEFVVSAGGGIPVGLAVGGSGRSRCGASPTPRCRSSSPS